MNKSKALMTGAAMVALSMPLALKDAQAATATLNASAIVVDAINLTQGTNLHFGSLSVSGVATFTITPAGARTVGGAANGLAGNTGQAGTFTISGATNAVDFTVAALGGGLNMTNTDPTNTGTIVLNALTMTGPWAGNLSFTTAATALAATLTAATGTINVGGVANAAGALASGTYVGTFTLDASYQ